MTPREVLRQAETEIDRAERLLELAHVAKRLSVCHETVYRLIRAKKLPAIKLDGGWRIARADLDAFIASRRTTTSNNTTQPRP